MTLREDIIKYSGETLEEGKSEFDWLSRIVGMEITNSIAGKLGINREYVDTFVNGKSAAFKK